jgi:hypothetical protein
MQKSYLAAALLLATATGEKANAPINATMVEKRTVILGHM